MRSFKAFAFVTVASVLLAGSLQAQWVGDVKWAGLYANTRTDYRSLSGTTWSTHRTYSSPYKATFLNVVTNLQSSVQPPLPSTWYLPGTAWGQVADIFCVDLLNYANTSTTYSANFTNVANVFDITRTTGRTTRLNDQTKYWQAAYLAQKIKGVDFASKEAKDMTGAIWAIMSGRTLERNVAPDYGTTNWVGDGIATQVADARANYGSVTASDWVIVTARDANGGINTASQEYITQVTPEPATMLLLGTGLVVMLLAAGALRRPMA